MGWVMILTLKWKTQQETLLQEMVAVASLQVVLWMRMAVLWRRG